MRVELFDDYKSVGHALIGSASVMLPALSVIFFGYELITFCLKRKKRREKVSEFIGDLFEFLAGAGLAALVIACSGFPACIG